MHKAPPTIDHFRDHHQEDHLCHGAHHHVQQRRYHGNINRTSEIPLQITRFAEDMNTPTATSRTRHVFLLLRQTRGSAAVVGILTGRYGRYAIPEDARNAVQLIFLILMCNIFTTPAHRSYRFGHQCQRHPHDL